MDLPNVCLASFYGRSQTFTIGALITAYKASFISSSGNSPDATQTNVVSLSRMAVLLEPMIF